jgi:filamentous hemagglutinin
MYQFDQSTLGNVPGVNVYYFPDMSPGQISNLLNSPGTTIGGFCNSAACLAPYK